MGMSQICCVFVCNMWKAGGIFAGINDQLNCTEQQNVDIYMMDFLDAVKPKSCTDTTGNLCQITGDYVLTLNRYGTQKMYTHMHEKCPSMAPDYKRSNTC